MLIHSQDISSVLSTIGKPADYITTGFRDLDKLIGGLLPGEFTVLAARPGQGKTSFTIDLMRSIGKTMPVMFLSLEMAATDIMERLLSSVSLVPQERLHSVDLSQVERDRIVCATDSINKLSLWVQDDPQLTPTKLNNYLTQFYQKVNKPFVFMLDYFQMMRGDTRGNSRTYELQEILDSIAISLKKLPVRCILVSQLNREAEKRENHWPKLSDLRDSGYIEQVADKVIFLHRPDYYAVSDGDFSTTDTGETYIIVAKNRRGRYGYVKVAFIPDIFSFRNISQEDKVELFDDKSIPF